MDDCALIRHLYSYDPETGDWRWRNPPAKALSANKAAPGWPAGTVDRRDGAKQLQFAGKIQRASRLAWLYVYGEWPKVQVLYRNPELPLPARDRLDNLKLAGATEDLTQATLHILLSYDQLTGIFRWRSSRKGVKAGAVAAGLKNTSAKSANLYIRIDGVDYPAQRLAWLYVHGRWPESRIAFADGNTTNCAISNLSESGFEHGTRQTPTISDEERRLRQAAAYRRSDLKRRFDLTEDEYNAMHDAQNGRCAICKEVETVTRVGKVRWLSVDHDHKDNNIRGLLCGTCNSGIGLLGDSIAMLIEAAIYKAKYPRPGEFEEARARLPRLLEILAKPPDFSWSEDSARNPG